MTTEERAQRAREAAARGIRDFTEPTSDDSDYDDDDDEARDEGRDTAKPASDDADERFFPPLVLPAMHLDKQPKSELAVHDQMLRELAHALYRDLLRQVRSRRNLLDSSLAVIPSIREAMSDLDYRMNRHEAFLADAELRYRQDRSRLLVKLNRLLSVFADLRRRQEERFPIVPAVERYREQEDLDDHDDATGDDPSRVPGGEEDRGY